MHAIVIDDDAVVRSLIQAQVESYGISVESFSNPREAMKHIRSSPPDLCIVDWRMPGIDGVTLVSDLRDDPACRSIYVIMVTAKTEMQDLIVAFRSGVDDYIRKPVHRGELSARIRAALRLIDLQAERSSHLAQVRELNDKLVHSNAMLQKLALTDELTGLPNRRAAMEGLKKLWSEWERYRIPFTIAIADLDHFKSINDTYGHAIGDEVLKQVAVLLKDHSRDADQLGRYGGEEFVIGMPSQSHESAVTALNRMRQTLASKCVIVNSKPLPVSFSIGVAEVGTDIRGLDELIRLADDVLYQAKHTGRDRVCIAAA